MSRHIVLDSTPTATSGQLVTAVTAWRLRHRSTRHNTVFQPPVNSSYDFGLWRVDRVTSWLVAVCTLSVCEGDCCGYVHYGICSHGQR